MWKGETESFIMGYTMLTQRYGLINFFLICTTKKHKNLALSSTRPTPLQFKNVNDNYYENFKDVRFLSNTKFSGKTIINYGLYPNQPLCRCASIHTNTRLVHTAQMTVYTQLDASGNNQNVPVWLVRRVSLQICWRHLHNKTSAVVKLTEICIDLDSEMCINTV